VSEFSTRAKRLADAYPDAPPDAEQGLARILWPKTLGSLRALRSVLDASPFAAEETQLLETYALAHVALLDALRVGRRR
jgi:hypothetical protein